MLLATSLTVCVVASFFLKIDVSVRSRGETDSLAGVKDAVSLAAGQVVRLPFEEGDSVHRDEVIGWVLMDSATEQQLVDLEKRLMKRLVELASSTFSPSQLGFSDALENEPSIRTALVDVEKKESALYNEQTITFANAKKQIILLQGRRAVVRKQLAYVKISRLKQYLIMQKDSLEDEDRKLTQQILVIQNDANTRMFEAKTEAQQSIRLAISTLRNFVLQHQIRSPIDGQIAHLAISPGTFVSERQAIASIIPLNSPIVAKVQVASQDVAKVHVGNPCIVSIDAYPSYKYGYFKGQVLSVDKVKSAEPGQRAAYVARVTIDPKTLARRPAFASHDLGDVHLRPGLKVEVRIVSQTASLANLALDKIFGGEL